MIEALLLAGCLLAQRHPTLALFGRKDLDSRSSLCAANGKAPEECQPADILGGPVEHLHGVAFWHDGDLKVLSSHGVRAICGIPLQTLNCGIAYDDKRNEALVYDEDAGRIQVLSTKDSTPLRSLSVVELKRKGVAVQRAAITWANVILDAKNDCSYVAMAGAGPTQEGFARSVVVRLSSDLRKAKVVESGCPIGIVQGKLAVYDERTQTVRIANHKARFAGVGKSSKNDPRRDGSLAVPAFAVFNDELLAIQPYGETILLRRYGVDLRLRSKEVLKSPQGFSFHRAAAF